VNQSLPLHVCGTHAEPAKHAMRLQLCVAHDPASPAGAIRSLKFEAFNHEWLKMAGPEAHQLMAAAAAWQQQQLQTYIQQLHQQQQAESGATPFNTLSKDPAQQQQQRQRREGLSGYYYEQQQLSEEPVAQYAGGYMSGAEQHERYEEEGSDAQQQQGQQLQWMQWPAGGGDDEGYGAQEGQAAACRSSSITRPSMVSAAGQCMVLDFDAFISDAGAA
jgi:hypothetical protein